LDFSGLRLRPLALRRYGMHSSTACASTGYVEGRNLVLHSRYSGGQDARYAELAAELMRLNVDVIVSSSTNGALAAKQLTSTIPIVTIVAGDPVGSGLVASLARPGGNVTGLTSQAPDWTAKQLQLLQEVAPGIKRVGVLWNPTLPQHQAGFRETQKAVATLRLEIESLELRSPDDLEAVFQRIAHTPLDGLQVYDQPASRTANALWTGQCVHVSRRSTASPTMSMTAGS
jgi:putative tryptophan/tyrosine transport system substrate-binding protein